VDVIGAPEEEVQITITEAGIVDAGTVKKHKERWLEEEKKKYVECIQKVSA